MMTLNERSRPALIAATVLAAVLAFFLLAKHTPDKTAHPRTLVFLDESLSMTKTSDNSGRTVQQLGLTFVDELVDDVLPPRSPMQVWAFASRTSVRSVWEGAPVDAEDLLALQEWVHDHPRTGEGTFALASFKKVLEEAHRLKGTDLLLVWASDGEWNDLDQLAPIASQLAALPNVKGIVVSPVSLEGDYRSRLETALQPFGQRVVIANKTDIEQAEERVRHLLAR